MKETDASGTKPALFLDTSIQIARQVHGPHTKKAIEKRLSQHARTVTSLVVRQEYKRRLLKEAEYLLGLLNRYQSFDEVHQHVIRLFGKWHERKRTICLQTLAQVHGYTDKERVKQLRLFLRSLLVTGLQRFDQMVDEVRKDSGCACALQNIVEKVELRKYEFGPKKCSQTKPGNCGVAGFVAAGNEQLELILKKLQSLPDDKKSAELTNAEKFLERVIQNPEKVNQDDPCLTVGDLLIALESFGIPCFYTLNGKESQHLCRALEQSLIVRPIDPTKDEVVCAADDPQWPVFGPMATN